MWPCLGCSVLRCLAPPLVPPQADNLEQSQTVLRMINIVVVPEQEIKEM